MRIGDLAKQTGIKASAIRFYESRGLLKFIPRKSNGYREYPEEAVLLLTIINNAQQAGFSLDEIQQILPPNISNWEHEKLISTLNKKIDEIEKLEKQLKQNKARLKEVIKAIEGKPADMACDDNARQLIKKLTKPAKTKRIN